LDGVDLLLPRASNHLRRQVDQAFACALISPRVVAEMETSDTLAAAVASGVGSTILPASMAKGMASTNGVDVRRIIAPRIEVPLVLCTSESLPLSEPAQAVRAILLELVERLVHPLSSISGPA
jgi:LysR family nitrogen assimilation transcriptional regulator